VHKIHADMLYRVNSLIRKVTAILDFTEKRATLKRPK